MIELAERYRKQIEYCEEQYGKKNYYKQLSCLQDFIKDNKGIYAKRLLTHSLSEHVFEQD